MNLIEISEQLKDVPDQYLMKEVQAPTGAYPAYLVVSEMTRRKRMRQSAMKERPETTVAQDLTQPSREEMMAAVAKMQQAQQAQLMAQPVAQPMSQPAPSLNAGLMATPQAAQELSAQDAMAAMQGGVPSFKQGGHVDENGVIRAFNGLPEEYEFGSYTTPDEIRAYQPLFPSIGSGNVDYKLEQLGYTKQQIAALDPASKRFITERAGSSVAPSVAPQTAQAPQSATTINMPAPPKAPQSAPLSVSSPYMTQMQQVFGDMRAMKQPSQEELAGLRAARAAEYEKAVPDRTTPMIEKILAQQGKDIEGRRGSNINEALVQAGLGMLSSKSPSFFRAAGEGGTAGLNAYRQGTKDIRDSERLMANSQIELAKAQTLRDQGKFEQGDKAEKDAMDKYKLAIDKGNTDMAGLARLQAGRTQEMQTQMAAMKLPYEIAAYGAKDGLKPIAPADAQLMRAQALSRLKERGVDLEKLTPEQRQQAVDREMLAYSALLSQRGGVPASGQNQYNGFSLQVNP
jgi:hypothetical protein